MVWVRSEYAGELAVLSAWLAALIPWNVTVASEQVPGYLFYLRFPFAEVQYLLGFDVGGRSFFLLSIAEAVTNQSGQVVYGAYLTWAAGAVLIGAAVLVSIAYYVEEEYVESGPVDPVRAIGALLAAAGGVLLVATYLLVTRGIPGIPLPIGAVLLAVIGGTLLRVERR